MRRLPSLVCLAFLASFPRLAASEPIIFSEALHGDLPGDPAHRVLLLDTGVNTVSGQIRFTRLFSDVDSEFDSYSFEGPVGSLLTVISYALLTTLLPHTTLAVSFFQLELGTPPTLQIVATPANLLIQGIAFSTVIPLRRGTYGLKHGVMGFDGIPSTDAQGFLQDYQWSLIVENDPVPEPATGALALIGVVGLYLRRRSVRHAPAPLPRRGRRRWFPRRGRRASRPQGEELSVRSVKRLSEVTPMCFLPRKKGT